MSSMRVDQLTVLQVIRSKIKSEGTMVVRYNDRLKIVNTTSKTFVVEIDGVEHILKPTPEYQAKIESSQVTRTGKLVDNIPVVEVTAKVSGMPPEGVPCIVDSSIAPFVKGRGNTYLAFLKSSINGFRIESLSEI